MKKSLVLAMAMALGVTASAYAANPFSDVPAGHWAYDSISKLADAGVIEGYGDTTFGGDKLMTRYEMAQIVAKAMARGANVDKLAAEFADELDALGVRVANLEKKADNVKITGQIRYNYKANHDHVSGYASNLRSRIWFTGQINDNWTYTGMLQNIQNLKNDDGDEDTKFQRAYVDGRIGGLKIRGGRYNFTDFAGGDFYDNRFDGIQASYGKDVKVTVGYGKADPKDSAYTIGKSADKDSDGKFLATYTDNKAISDDVFYADLAGKAGNFALHASYYSFKDLNEESGIDDKVWGVGAGYNFGKTAFLGVEYLNADVDDYDGDDDGIIVTAKYKGAKASQPGSWGLVAKYYDQGYGTALAPTFNATTTDLGKASEGFKGYSVAANYAFAKNIVGQVEWYDLEEKHGDTVNDQTLWSQLVFTF